jgi:hypothetical protein
MLRVDVFGIVVHQKKREKATEKFFRKRKKIELEFLLRKDLVLGPIVIFKRTKANNNLREELEKKESTNKLAKRGSGRSPGSLNCTKSMGMLALLGYARRPLRPPVPWHIHAARRGGGAARAAAG